MEDDLHNIMGRRKDGGPADTKAQEHDVKTSTGFVKTQHWVPMAAVLGAWAEFPWPSIYNMAFYTYILSSVGSPSMPKMIQAQKRA